MRAVLAEQPGGPEVLTATELPDPVPGPGEVVLDVAAAGLNRADLLQRQGHYPPPPGASDVIGLECSGTISAVGPGVRGWEVGAPVAALLAGGGYATKVAVPAGQLMPVPDGVDLVAAAALPEVACTVWSNVYMVGGLQTHETLLVHGGTGGIGSFAVQLATALGQRILATVGSAEKVAYLAERGVEAYDYHDDWVELVTSATEGRGVDVILDVMGAKYLKPNIAALADSGRLVIIGMQGGVKAELNIGALLAKRGAVIATALRSRTVEDKSAICASVVEHVWPLVAAGKISPTVHETYPLEQAGDAHRAMESGEHIGKILLTTAR